MPVNKTSRIRGCQAPKALWEAKTGLDVPKLNQFLSTLRAGLVTML